MQAIITMMIRTITKKNALSSMKLKPGVTTGMKIGKTSRARGAKERVNRRSIAEFVKRRKLIQTRSK